MIRSEEANDYPVVTQLSDDWRIIVCKAGIQWILQHRAGQRHGRARWTGRSYCRTSEALNRLSRKHVNDLPPAAAAILAALPERIDDPPPIPRSGDGMMIEDASAPGDVP
jgi:hypothetical protein